MRYALMSEPQQGLAYSEILALARTAEEAGFEAYFRSDHYASFPGEAGLPTTDAWATLAGLARETSRISLGTLVSPVTFRLPGNFAKVVTTVAEMADGRLEVGLGAGWNEGEHRQLGLPFPGVGERFAMLEQQLAILHGLWTEPDGWRYDGAHWQLRDARFYAKPPALAGRRHPNLIIGGEGGPRMARLVASYADEFNLTSASIERVEPAYERIRAACVEIGRSPDELTYSAMVGVLVGRDDAEVNRRARELLRAFGHSDESGAAWFEERRERWIFGTPHRARESAAAYAAKGVERIMLQDFLPRDLEMVRVLGEIFKLPAPG